MKLLRDKKEVERLQEFINNYTGKNKPIPEKCAVNNVGKRKKRTGYKMRLTTQIGECEMNQVMSYLRGLKLLG